MTARSTEVSVEATETLTERGARGESSAPASLPGDAGVAGRVESRVGADAWRGLGGGKRVVQLTAPDNGMTITYSVHDLAHCLGLAGFRKIKMGKRGVTRKAARVMHAVGLLRNMMRLPGYALFVQTHAMSVGQLFPACHFFEVIPYAWDCWPNRYGLWETFLKRLRVKLAFISARDSVEEMQRRLPGVKFVWLPEAVEPGKCLPDKPLAERGIDVVAMGRRHADHHAAVIQALTGAGRSYRYEKVRWREGVFPPGREDYAKGLGDTKVMISFPASVTHPEWAGKVATATLRYFECMASRVLLLGQAPQELVDLLGYNPVVEADMRDPAGQLLDILSHIETYQPLVDKNYRRVLEVGTWEYRVKKVCGVLKECGYTY